MATRYRFAHILIRLLTPPSQVRTPTSFRYNNAQHQWQHNTRLSFRSPRYSFPFRCRFSRSTNENGTVGSVLR
jgi:hypothetical protein